MPRKIRLSADALQDLYDIDAYVSEADSPERAESVLRRIENAIAALGEHPDRGTIPRELAAYGDTRFREVFFKPYRIVYQALAAEVRILLIADGRRDMRSLLARRLLGAEE